MSLPDEALWWGVTMASDVDGSSSNRCADAPISGGPLLFFPLLAAQGGDGRRESSSGARGSGGRQGSSLISVSWCSADRSPLRCFTSLSWGKQAELLEMESPCSNKHRCCSRAGSLSAPINLVVRGGEELEKSSKAATFRGRSLHSVELIIADAFIASAILCRQGRISSTSMLEACSQHCRGCSNSLRGEVIHSPHRGEGPRWMSIVGGGSRAAGPCSSAVTPRGHR
jgi:hypothetical protein